MGSLIASAFRLAVVDPRGSFESNELPSRLPSPFVMLEVEKYCLLSFRVHHCSIICRRSSVSKSLSLRRPTGALRVDITGKLFTSAPMKNPVLKSGSALVLRLGQWDS